MQKPEPRRAERLFAAWLKHREAADAATDFAGFCQRHPGDAEQLILLENAWRRYRLLLDELDPETGAITELLSEGELASLQRVIALLSQAAEERAPPDEGASEGPSPTNGDAEPHGDQD